MNLWTIEDDRARLRLHPGQAPVWQSDKRITAMVAGTQGGKTSFGPWWLWRLIRQAGSGDYLAVTATFDLFKLKMLPEIKTVFESVLGIGRYWAGDRVMEICENAQPGSKFLAKKSDDAMWGRIILRSADSPGGLESGTAKGAWLDEAGQDRFTLLAWRAIRRRLSIHRGPILITTTLYNLGWVNQKIITAVEGGETRLVVLPNGAEIEVTEKDDIRLVQFDSISNPIFPPEEYEAARAEMPDDEFAMFYRGRVAKLRTLIYDVFDERIHKVNPFPIPDTWPRAIGVDPLGAQIGAVWLAFDPEKGQLHVYREYMEPFGITTGGHVKNVLELSRRERIAAAVGGGPSERQARTDWTAAGLPLAESPVKEVWSGIDRVYALFKTMGLVIHGNCENLLSELGSYQRRRNQAGELTDNIKDKDQYHLLDALRYVVSWLTEPGEAAQVIYSPVRIGRNY